jgi:hypothetical protein
VGESGLADGHEVSISSDTVGDAVDDPGLTDGFGTNVGDPT